MSAEENLLAGLSKEDLLTRLQSQTDRYNKLFQNSLVAMMIIRLDDGQIIEANKNCLDLLYLKGVANANFFQFLKAANRKQFQHQLEDSEQIDNLELELSGEAGSKWVSCSARLNSDGCTADCILIDITESRDRLNELKKVNFELDSFVYHASHDLRSPLRSILGLIDIYRLEENKKTKTECIEKIEGSVRRLDDLVMELLSISRNDRINDPHVEMNLMYEINNSISSYYNASDTKGLEIRAEIKQPVPFISDLTRVRIILNNLISNALKYRSFENETDFISIKAKVNMKGLELTVEDNGEGIAENKLPHIFDMFYRATEKSEGSGLGLYIVKKVADKLKASIEVQSFELEGTTFTVFIPNSLNKESVRS
ncbi:MAG: PAS domain-containing sensor histidine kinase [Bacteroidota bacterium]